MIEVSENAALARLREVQLRNEQAAEAVLTREGKDAKPSRMLNEIRAYLEEAFNEKLIREPPHEVRGIVLMSPPTPDESDRSVKYVQISVGKGRNFKSREGLPRLTRADGAWFDFGITLRLSGSEAELFAYAFALRMAEGAPVKQVRIDLNGRGHANEALGLRSHVHLNVDDEGFAIPSPVMTPIEVLDIILFSLIPGKGRTRSGA